MGIISIGDTYRERGRKIQNAECKMQNHGIGVADDLKHARRAYHNSALCILHGSSLQGDPENTKLRIIF